MLKGSPPVLAQSCEHTYAFLFLQVRAYANVNGLFAVSAAGLPLLDAVHAAISRAKTKNAPAYD